MFIGDSIMIFRRIYRWIVNVCPGYFIYGSFRKVEVLIIYKTFAMFINSRYSLSVYKKIMKSLVYEIFYERHLLINFQINLYFPFVDLCL